MFKIKVSVEELKKKKLFIGLPMYGGVCSGYTAKGLIELSEALTKYGIAYQIYYLFNESLVTRARNIISDVFLRSDSDYLLFIDSDIDFGYQAVIDLMAIMVSDEEKYPILGAPYGKKGIAWEKVAKAVKMGFGDKSVGYKDLEDFGGDFVFAAAKGIKQFRTDDLLEVSEAGTGFLLISKKVFKALEAQYPENRYFPDHGRSDEFRGDREINMFFNAEIDPETRRYLSEDYFFIKNAIGLGFKAHLVPWIPLGHVGSYRYGGKLPSLGLIGAGHSVDTKLFDKK